MRWGVTLAGSSSASGSSNAAWLPTTSARRVAAACIPRECSTWGGVPRVRTTALTMASRMVRPPGTPRSPARFGSTGSNVALVWSSNSSPYFSSRSSVGVSTLAGL